MTYVNNFVDLILVCNGKVQHSVHDKTVWQYFLCFEPQYLSSQFGNCTIMSSDGDDFSRLGIISSARMTLGSLLSLCSVATMLVKNELFLFLNTQHITSICSYSSYEILVKRLLKLTTFKEKVNLKSRLEHRSSSVDFYFCFHPAFTRSS